MCLVRPSSRLTGDGQIGSWQDRTREVLQSQVSGWQYRRQEVVSPCCVACAVMMMSDKLDVGLPSSAWVVERTLLAPDQGTPDNPNHIRRCSTSDHHQTVMLPSL